MRAFADSCARSEYTPRLLAISLSLSAPRRRELERGAQALARALDEESEFLDPAEVGQRSAVAAALLSHSGARERSIPFFDRALELFDVAETRDRRYFDTLNDRAIALAEIDRLDEARDDMRRARDHAETLDDRELVQRATVNLGEIERRRGEITIAVDLLAEGLQEARSIGDSALIFEAAENLVLALEDPNRLDEAEDRLEEMGQLARAEDADALKTRVAVAKGRLAFVRGDFGAAARENTVALDLDRTNEAGKRTMALGGRLESLSQDQALEGLEGTLQALVDRVHEGEDPELVIGYVCRSAWTWLHHGADEEAVSLFAAAILIGALGSADDLDRDQQADPGAEQEIGDSLRPVTVALTLLVRATHEEKPDEEQGVYDEMVRFLNEQHDGVGDAVLPLLTTVRAAAGSAEDQAGGEQDKS